MEIFLHNPKKDPKFLDWVKKQGYNVLDKGKRGVVVEIEEEELEEIQYTKNLEFSVIEE